MEADIEGDFKKAITGIKMLPYSSRGGVYLAYRYYYNLFLKIKALPSSRVLEERIRIPNSNKLALLIESMVMHQFKLI